MPVNAIVLLWLGVLAQGMPVKIIAHRNENLETSKAQGNKLDNKTEFDWLKKTLDSLDRMRDFREVPGSRLRVSGLLRSGDNPELETEWEVYSTNDENIAETKRIVSSKEFQAPRKEWAAVSSASVDNKDGSSVNLNIIPLAALLAFVLFCCCKCCRWALEDIREWDDTHVQVIRPKNSFSMERETTFDPRSSGTHTRRKRRSGHRLQNIWRRSRIEPDFSALEYAASLGYLPGVAFRSFSADGSGKEMEQLVARGGTSPVAQAAAFPERISCRLASDRPLSHRTEQCWKNRSLSCGNSLMARRKGSRGSLRCENQKKLGRCLGDLSCSAPYIPGDAWPLTDLGNRGLVESVPLIRSDSAKSSSAATTKSRCEAQQQCRRAVLLLQGGQRKRAHRQSSESTHSGSTFSSQATSMTSLRVLSQTTGSLSNVDSVQTSQTNLSPSETNNSRRGSERNSLPRSPWPTKLELRGSYYEDSIFVDQNFPFPLSCLSSYDAAADTSLETVHTKTLEDFDLNAFVPDQTGKDAGPTDSDPSHPATSLSSSSSSKSSEYTCDGPGDLP